MPEMTFTVRWPDGATQRCYSPSLVVRRLPRPRARPTPSTSFVRRSRRRPWRARSERVRAKLRLRLHRRRRARPTIRARRGARSGPDVVAVERMRRAPSRVRAPRPDDSTATVPVVVVGGGQAGLSRELVPHQRGRRPRRARAPTARRTTGATQRWDNFCLVTPNWQCRLPGLPVRRRRPRRLHGQGRDRRLPRRLRRSFDPPLREGVAVTRLPQRDGGGFARLEHRAVRRRRSTARPSRSCVAVGGYHVPRVPPLAAALARRSRSCTRSHYRNAARAARRRGAGRRHRPVRRADRRGPAPRGPRGAPGRRRRAARAPASTAAATCVAWLDDMGHYDMPDRRAPRGHAARARRPTTT